MLLRRTLYLTALLLIFTKPFAQVNLQTGTATFSLPMFNWQDHKSGLNSLVALSYNSGNGLKVSDVASNVGQGWNLVAGGVVTRMQLGEPDDQPARLGNEMDKKKYPAGYFYASVPAANGCPIALTKYPIYKSRNQVYTQHNVLAEDKQLDYFSFQFNGKGGMFVLQKPVSGASSGAGVSLGDSKMKITYQLDAALISQGIRTRITSFTIQDVDGLLYKFSTHGLTKVLENAYCDADQTYRQVQPKFEKDLAYHQSGFDLGEYENPWIVGSWYLAEIKDPLTLRTISLSYVSRNVNASAGEDLSYNHDKDYTIISHKKSITQTPEISSIILPDGHNVSFNYGKQRTDFAGQYELSSVAITYQGRSLSQYLLSTTYFIGNRYGTPSSDYQKKMARLCLKSVQKIGVDAKEDSPPYIFDYNLGSNNPDDVVPAPFSYRKDVWGFYNGDKSIQANTGAPIPLNLSLNQLSNQQLKGLCFAVNGTYGVYLNPKTGYAKNGLLKQVIYPTGGTLSYVYEQNWGTLSNTYREVGGVHVV
ncbi:MAG TPA: hypothetical protein VEY06_12080, partial [Flavisolibacter sp.]|nr:hypothetical protein [Flavisolibacter sp.]